MNPCLLTSPELGSLDKRYCGAGGLILCIPVRGHRRLEITISSVLTLTIKVPPETLASLIT